jgi:hypothetical protein
MTTKTKVKNFMKKNNIPGTVSGRGRDWEVELPNDEAHDRWNELTTFPNGGYRSGYGSWVLSPSYKSKGDFNNRSSAWHY